MILARALVLALVMAVVGTPSHAQEYVDRSKQFIEVLADRAIATAAADLTDAEVRHQIQELLNDGFAVRGIARYVLGRYWRRASEDDRAEYLELFEDVVISISADRLSKYSGQSFEVTTAVAATSANSREQAAIVRSLFHVSDESQVRVDWRVASLGDTYKITDVVLEGVSLANTYRDEFTSVVRRDGIDGLLAELRKQRDEIAMAGAELPTGQ